MTSIRKTKKNNVKLLVQLYEMRTHSKVRHYSRFVRRSKKWFWQFADLLLLWQGPLQHTKKQDDISDMLSSQVRDHLDIPELNFSRDKIINGDGYYWLHSDGKLHASCLSSSPVRVYGPPTLSSLADPRCIRSYLHCPIQLSPSEAETIRKQLDWQLKYYKDEEKRKK